LPLVQVLPELPENARYKFHVNECALSSLGIELSCFSHAAGHADHPECKLRTAVGLQSLQVGICFGGMLAAGSMLSPTFPRSPAALRRCFDWGTIGWVLEQVMQSSLLHRQ